MKNIHFLFLGLICSSCTMGMSIEDRFIHASAEIACVYNPSKNTEQSIMSPEELEKKSNTLQKTIETIARKYDFNDIKELDDLSQQYKFNPVIISKTQEKIQSLCPPQQ